MGFEKTVLAKEQRGISQGPVKEKKYGFDC